LKLGDVTLLALPLVWLRAPDRVGLLAPRVAWRASDGLLLGPGLHLPWRERSGALAALDLHLSGYARGGGELAAAMHTGGAHTFLRVDHLRGTLVQLQATGARVDGDAAVSWTADLARGDRAPRALLGLQDASRRYDEARAQVAVLPVRSLALATGLELWGERLEQGALAVGPVASLSSGGAVGAAGSWDVSVTSRTLSAAQSAASQVSRGWAAADLGGRAGPLLVSWLSRANAVAALASGGEAVDLAAGTAVRSGLPLGRRFGNVSAPLVHVVEPFVQASAMAAHVTSPPPGWLDRPGGLASGQHWLSSAGVRTAAGSPGSGSAAEAQLAAGTLGRFERSEPAVAVLASVHAQAPWAALRTEAAWLGAGGAQGRVALVRARAGALRGPHVRARLALQQGVEPSLARALTWGEPHSVGAGWLDRAGSSLGLDAATPLGAGYGLMAGADADGAERRLLAARGGVSYAHPCGCLRASVWVSQRLGRDGVDGWLALDLAPR
jgi:hypothetical protein